MVETIRYEPSSKGRVKISNPGKDLSSLVLLDVPANLSSVELRVGPEVFFIYDIESNQNLLEKILYDIDRFPVSIAQYCEVFVEFGFVPRYETQEYTVNIPMYSDDYYSIEDDGEFREDRMVLGYKQETRTKQVRTKYETPRFEVTWCEPLDLQEFSIWEDFLVGKDEEHMQKLKDKFKVIDTEKGNIRIRNTVYVMSGIMGKKYCFELSRP